MKLYKKLAAVVLTATMILGLTACGGTASNTDSNIPSENSLDSTYPSNQSARLFRAYCHSTFYTGVFG